jgi:hypothetical protein
MDNGILRNNIAEPTGAGHYRMGNHDYNRASEQIVLAITTVVLPSGTMLGRVKVGALSAVAAAPVSGTGAAPGNGNLGAITVDPGAPVGVYQVRFTDATHFEVLRPDGTVEGNGELAVAYNGAPGINFTGAAGGTPFVEDDRIAVTVSAAAASGQYKPIDPAALDGTQEFAAILYQERPINTATQRAVGDVRETTANGRLLTYINAVSGPQKAAIEAQAAAAGVIIRY